MTRQRNEARRPRRRAFQPTVEGQRLESRVVLSTTHPVKIQTASGGKAIVVTDIYGERFFVSVFGGGTVQGSVATGGRVNLVVQGSTVTSLLEVNRILPAIPGTQTSGAHKFNNQLANQYGMLNIASITVTDGTISDIEGYHDAVLSGPIIAGSTNPVDRIALEAILPGGAIGVGGDLNTLDVLTDANFTGGTGLFVGRDLNWFEVGGNLTFAGGANMNIVRDLGYSPQPAKGTGNAGQGMNVLGNFTISTGDVASIGRANDFGILISGNFTGYSNFSIAGVSLATSAPANISVRGTATP
jgi:hypothetical protein